VGAVSSRSFRIETPRLFRRLPNWGSGRRTWLGELPNRGSIRLTKRLIPLILQGHDLCSQAFHLFTLARQLHLQLTILFNVFLRARTHRAEGFNFFGGIAQITFKRIIFTPQVDEIFDRHPETLLHVGNWLLCLVQSGLQLSQLPLEVVLKAPIVACFKGVHRDPHSLRHRRSIH